MLGQAPPPCLPEHDLSALRSLSAQVRACRGRKRSLRDPEDRVHERCLSARRGILGGGDRTGCSERQTRPGCGEALLEYGIAALFEDVRIVWVLIFVPKRSLHLWWYEAWRGGRGSPHLCSARITHTWYIAIEMSAMSCSRQFEVTLHLRA